MSKPCVFVDEGEGNWTNHLDMDRPPYRLEMYGRGNQIRLDPRADLSGFFIKVKGNNNIVAIAKDCVLRGLVYVQGNKSSLRVASHTTAAGVRFSVGARASITVGRDCMFSRNIEIRCSDEHPMYDLDSREEINAGRNVDIGEHVWIGEGVRVLKGMTIASGSIVGTGSMITRPLTEANGVYVGSPARLVRSRTAWSRTPNSMDWDRVDFTQPDSPAADTSDLGT